MGRSDTRYVRGIATAPYMCLCEGWLRSNVLVSRHLRPSCVVQHRRASLEFIRESLTRDQADVRLNAVYDHLHKDGEGHAAVGGEIHLTVLREMGLDTFCELVEVRLRPNVDGAHSCTDRKYRCEGEEHTQYCIIRSVFLKVSSALTLYEAFRGSYTRNSCFRSREQIELSPFVMARHLLEFISFAIPSETSKVSLLIRATTGTILCAHFWPGALR